MAPVAIALAKLGYSLYQLKAVILDDVRFSYW